MVRAAAKNHASVAVVDLAGALRRRARRGRGRRVHAGAAPAARRRGVRAHRDVRRGGGVVDAAACWRRPRRAGVPGVARGDLATGPRCCATARTRTSGGAVPAAGRSAGSPTPSSCTARRCRTTTTSTPTRRGGRRTTSTEPGGRDHQARQPVRHRGRAPTSPTRTRKAHACDPVSAFGGVIAANRPVTAAMAEQVAEVFTEVDRGAGVSTTDALELLPGKKNIRLLRLPERRQPGRSRDPGRSAAACCCRRGDRIDAAGRRPGDAGRWRGRAGGRRRRWPTCAFAWRAVPAVKSNAILLAADGAAVGVGMGQVNRVDSCRLAVERAGARAGRGSVAASDAFFPFADGLEVLLDAGVRAVVQPGGSMRDERGRRGRAGGRRHDVLHRHPPLRALIRTPIHRALGRLGCPQSDVSELTHL